MSTSAGAVLVTGASGFLGRHACRELARHGHEVFGAGRDEARLLQAVTREKAIVGDLAGLADIRLPVEAVIHCAALSSPWGSWRSFHRANVAGTRQVVEFARKNGARRIVHVSSPSVYAARRHRLGIREEEVDESNRLNGYIRSKIAAEGLLQEALGRGEVEELVILRPRGLIGVGDPSLLPRLMHVHDRYGVPLFDGGEHLIDVTAVENVATALRLALSAGDARGGVYNITNGEPRPFRELVATLLGERGTTPRFREASLRTAWIAATILESLCKATPGRPEPPLTRYTLSTIAYAQTLDIARARAELGYSPELGLDEALRRLGAELRAQR